MTIHPDLATLYVTGSVLVTTGVVYVLHVLGSALGRKLFGAEPRLAHSLDAPGGDPQASTE
jgi:hypothetical protein